MKKIDFLGIIHVLLVLGVTYLMISNELAINNVLLLIGILLLSINYFLKKYKSKK